MRRIGRCLPLTSQCEFLTLVVLTLAALQHSLITWSTYSELTYLTHTALSVTRNHYQPQLHLRRTDFTVRLALSNDIMEPITTDGLEYPVSKRRRTTTLVSKKQSMDVRT